MDAGNGKPEPGSVSRPAIRSYDDLEVFQRAMQLLVPAHAVAGKLPKYEQFELASQLRRASKSIPTNIAEGYGKKRSLPQFKAYLDIALGSANEVIVHLKIASAFYASEQETSPLIDSYTIVAKQLHTLIANWKTFPTSTLKPSRVPLPASRIQPEGANR